MSEILGTGIFFPLQVDRCGRLAVARDEIDVEQALWLILSTAPGERPMRPEFGCGVHELVFDRIDGETVGRLDRAIRIALDRWEPRVEVVSIAFDFADSDAGKLTVEIGYRIRATNDVRNLVYPFYVVPAGDQE
ncbi:MAG TPA: GPW/gp25 family protein [Solirubrobacteraceae bacterium]|nr:GPW/gp25 family protein [Solirubrobacteraceae bacterium]